MSALGDGQRVNPWLLRLSPLPVGDCAFSATDSHAQMVAFGFDVRVDDLIVEKLRGLRLARNAPVVEVKQPAEERELPLPVQDFDLHEVRELPGECLHALVKAGNITLDLAAQ